MSRNFLTEAYQRLRQRLQQGSFHLEEDALSDAFCQLWAKGYDPQTATDGERLLTAAASRRQISLWRRQRSHPHTALGEMQIPDPPPDTGREELYEEVSRLIETQLTPLQRDILNRRDRDGETYQSIAQQLGMQEAAVRMQLSRARKTIRETYKKTKR